MRKFFAIFNLAVKYLYRYRRRYIFLLTALSMCFAVVTFITSTKDGMYKNVYYVGQSHYAGDLIIRCHDADGGDRYNLNQNEITAILNAVQIAGINPEHTVLRTVYFDNASVFFNGNVIPIRYVVGCDWENEAFLFNKMTNIENKPVDLIAGDDGIILSLPTAQALGAKIGDSVILEVGTINGKNTGAFILKEIVKDVSIFGYYKAFVSRTSLNRLKLYDDENCSIIGLFFENKGISEKKRAVLQKIMPQYLRTGEIVHNRDESNKEIDKITEGRVFFIYSLPVYLSELSYLLDSMDIIAYVIYIMMLLIIMVSTIVTYRLILHERSKEMGIMVTIGFAGRDLRLVLLTEIILLTIISLVWGSILSYLFSWAASFISFSWMPSFEIFMKNGKLSPLYLPSTTLVNVIIIFLMLFLLTLFPSFRVSRKKIPALLSGEAI